MTGDGDDRRRLKQHLVGEHVRKLRSDLGMSVRTLASLTDFSPSFISQVENGHVSPSINSMQKIASALKVSLGEFFAVAAGGDAGVIVRASERQVLVSGWSHAQLEALSGASGGHNLEPLLVTLEPGGRSGKHPYEREHEEFVFVLEGAVTVTLGPETHRLERGDAVTVLPRELRLFVNETSDPVRLLVVTARCDR